MKAHTLISVLVAAAIVVGCQAVKDVGGNVASSFQSSEKKFVQRTINQWTTLARVEIRWNEVPMAHQGRNLDNLPTLIRFLRLTASKDVPFVVSCFPRATTYPRSRDSIIKQELIIVAVALAQVVVLCNATPDSEKYQVEYETVKWVLTRMREAGLTVPAASQQGMVCAMDEMVQQYKQQNAGQPVDADVLDWIKENQLWGCRFETP